MIEMFRGAKKFNKSLNNWDTRLVTSMNSMFRETDEFNGDIKDWSLVNVVDINSMFEDAKKFNSDISNWNTSNIKHMLNLFKGNFVFDKPLDKWNVISLITGIDGKIFTEGSSKLSSGPRKYLGLPNSYDITLISNDSDKKTWSGFYDERCLPLTGGYVMGGRGPKNSKIRGIDQEKDTRQYLKRRSNFRTCKAESPDYVGEDVGFAFGGTLSKWKDSRVFDNAYYILKGNKLDPMSGRGLTWTPPPPEAKEYFGKCINDFNKDNICDEEDVLGCMNKLACNYNSKATVQKLSNLMGGEEAKCIFPDEKTGMCPDGTCGVFEDTNEPINSDVRFKKDEDINNNGICDKKEILGCTDISACNFDKNATINGFGENDKCNYPRKGFSCDEPALCFTKTDCKGVCGGLAKKDKCGVCDGDGSTCDIDYFKINKILVGITCVILIISVYMSLKYIKKKFK